MCDRMLAALPPPIGKNERLKRLEIQVKAARSRALLLAELGHTAKAQEALDESARLIDELYSGRRGGKGRDEFLVKHHKVAARLRLQAGNSTAAERELAAAYALCEANCIGSAASWLERRDGVLRAQLGLLQEQGRHAEALVLIDRLQASPHGETDSLLYRHALSLAALGRHAEALPLAQEAVAQIERHRANFRPNEIASGFIESHIGKYDLLIDLTVRSGGNVDSYLDLSGRAKARHFSTHIDKGDRPAAAPVSFPTYGPAKWRAECRMLLPQAQAILREAGEEESAGELLSHLHEYFVVLDEGGDIPPSPVTASEMQQLLPADMLLLDFYQLDESLLMLAVTHDTAELHRLPLGLRETRDAARGLLATLMEMQRRPRPSPDICELFNWQAKALHTTLFAPLEHLLSRHARLLLCPHRALHRVPFALLVSGDSRYLTQSHTIAYVPSLASMRRAIDRAGRDRVLVISNSTGDLESASIEGRKAVAHLFPHQQHFDREQATPANLQAHIAGADVVHIACHNRFDPQGLTRTFIPLHGGKLTTESVLRCRLSRHPLVVLSACDSGLAFERRSDELDSFAHAFLIAGARAVIVTLWPIDDAGTPLLIRHFYTGWREHGDAVRALQVTMQDAISSRLSPHLFGSFKVIQ